VTGRVNRGNAASEKDVSSLGTVVRESASASPIVGAVVRVGGTRYIL